MPKFWKDSSNNKLTSSSSKIKLSGGVLSAWLLTRFTRLNISKRTNKSVTYPMVENISQPGAISSLEQHFQFGSPRCIELSWKTQQEESLTPWQTLWKEVNTFTMSTTQARSRPKRKRKNGTVTKPVNTLRSIAANRQLQLSLDQWECFSRTVTEIDNLPQNSRRRITELQSAFDYYKSSATTEAFHIENKDSNTNVVVQEGSPPVVEVKQFRFLDLPTELRVKIYELLLRQRPNLRLQLIYRLREFRRNKDGVMQLPLESTLHPDILRVNQQIHREASAVLYGKGIVEFQRNLKPLTLNPPRNTSPWIFIQNLVVHRILPAPKMPHTPGSWREIMLSDLHFDTLNSLQTAWFEFALHSPHATGASDMVEPIYTAVETLLIERKQLNPSSPTLNIVTFGFIGALRSRFGRWYSGFDNAATGTVFIGLVAEKIKEPKDFSLCSDAMRPKGYEMVWCDFRNSRLPWVKAETDLGFLESSNMNAVV